MREKDIFFQCKESAFDGPIERPTWSQNLGNTGVKTQGQKFFFFWGGGRGGGMKYVILLYRLTRKMFSDYGKYLNNKQISDMSCNLRNSDK
jgi:hypothetical protein